MHCRDFNAKFLIAENILESEDFAKANKEANA